MHFTQKVYQLEIARLQEKRCCSGSEMERIQAFPVGHIDFKLRKMYIEVLQGGLYELRTPRKKLKLLPQSALDEIDSYVDYIFLALFPQMVVDKFKMT